MGLSLGAAALLRQAILPWAAALFLYLLWAGYRSGRTAAALRALFTAGVIILLFILPFTARNYRAYGELLLLNSNTGYAMYSAQHPLHGVSFQAFAAAPLPDDLTPRPANEAQWERALMRRGIEFVMAEPVRYLRLSLSRVVDYFKFWPSAETTLLHNAGRVASFGLFLPFMLYGLWLSRTERRRYRLLYLFILFYSVLHIFTWAMIRLCRWTPSSFSSRRWRSTSFGGGSGMPAPAPHSRKRAARIRSRRPNRLSRLGLDSATPRTRHMSQVCSVFCRIFSLRHLSYL